MQHLALGSRQHLSHRKRETKYATMLTFLPTTLRSLAQQIPPTPLWDPFMFFHILNQWYINGHHHQIYKNSLHLNPKISQPALASPQDSVAVRVARDVPRIGSSHPESPPVKWSAWIEPLNLGSEHNKGPRDPQNSYRKWSKSHGNIWRTYTLAMENCHALLISILSKPSINGPFSMAMLDNQRVDMNWIGWVEWDSPFSEPHTFVETKVKKQMFLL